MHERVYIPGEDDAEILALRSKVWGTDHPHTSAVYLKWLFQECPDGAGTGVITTSKGKTTGFAGMILRKARVGDEEFLVAIGLEYMMDPEVMKRMGRSLLRLLHAHAERIVDVEADFTITYPNNSAVRLLTSKIIGYKLLFQINLLVRPLPGFRFLEKGDGNIVVEGLKVVAARSAALCLAACSWRGNGAIEIEEVDQFDHRFDTLDDDVAKDGKIRLSRSSDYLTWRYSQHPVYDYKILVAKKDDRLLGYIIYSPRQVFNTDAGLICDLSVADTDGSVAKTLVNAAAKKAHKDGLSILVDQRFLTESRENGLFDLGFIRIPQNHNPKPFRMVVKDLTARGQIVHEKDRWVFAWGDMDVV